MWKMWEAGAQGDVGWGATEASEGSRVGSGGLGTHTHTHSCVADSEKSNSRRLRFPVCAKGEEATTRDKGRQEAGSGEVGEGPCVTGSGWVQ